MNLLDPRTKSITTLYMVLVIAITPCGSYYKFLLYLLLIMVLIIWARISVRMLLKRLWVTIPLVSFLLLLQVTEPKAFSQSSQSIMYSLIIKTFLIVICLGFLNLGTPFHQLIKGLSRFKMPAIFINMLFFSHRYLLLFAEETRRLNQAISSRSGGMGFIKRITVTSRLIPHSFVRVLTRGGKIYTAMLSRGYDRDLPFIFSIRLTLIDLVYSILIFTSFLGVFLLT